MGKILITKFFNGFLTDAPLLFCVNNNNVLLFSNNDELLKVLKRTLVILIKGQGQDQISAMQLLNKITYLMETATSVVLLVSCIIIIILGQS